MSWLTGPIFAKELRVSARRRRNYGLRFGFLVLLTLFVVLVWMAWVQPLRTTRGSYQIVRMAEAGKYIILTIVVFQFCATQLLAVIMLSTSISDEIYHGTLGVLMTTPINSLQIVMGKLFSKLLQLVLFLGLGLPLLAMVRVFGGVPWNYIISSFCITLTAIIFVGSLSLFFSVYNRRAYVVILKVFLIVGGLFLLVPWLSIFSMAFLFRFGQPPVYFEFVLYIFSLANPYITFFIETGLMMEPGGLGIGAAFFNYYSWPLHCVIMLALSGLLLAWSVFRVRKVALRQACGSTIRSTKASKAQAGGGAKATAGAGTIRRIKGCPIVWKEMHHPLLGPRRIRTIISIVFLVGMLLFTYWLSARTNSLDNDDTQVAYVVVFTLVGMLWCAVLSATNITTEKESRSWPLLLATTLNDRQILMGKALGNMRRCLPIWLFLLGHVLIFSVVGYIHPMALVYLGMLVVWITLFFTGTGLYFGSLFKRTTQAVMANLSLAVFIWGILPILLGLFGEITRFYGDLVGAYLDYTNPVVHAIVIMYAMTSEWGWFSFDWIEISDRGIWEGTSLMITATFGYLLLAFLFALRARRRLRRNLF
ncbi:ABC transporter permease subunit [Planctomycetota bacterium]